MTLTDPERFLRRLSSLVTSRLRSGPKVLPMSCLALSLALIAAGLEAQEKRDISSLSVDDLMNVEVTSVSKKGQKLSDTAAAVFVISQDDIRRSGATSIPEILRMVPGLDVARINGNSWAISARGSNAQFANKLLVMIDGRSVYTPLFSGVYWDVQDTLLEDVDRIEVIRGPGGTLWGANAVNGIINIITKHAIETQGTLLSAGGGTEEGLSGAARYGGALGRNAYYRAYAKSFDRPDSAAGSIENHDAWRVGRAGFRADWAARRGDDFTIQGDSYQGSETSLGAFDSGGSFSFADRASSNKVAGHHLQFRWAAIQSSRSDTTLAAFYAYTTRSQPGIDLARHTIDVDFQQHLKFGGRNDAVWGAQYRHSGDRVAGTAMRLVRDSNVTSIASVFVQNEMQVTRRFRVTAGTKVQYDRASRFQLQPTVRLLFKASERQTIWAAATSAVRTPSELELYGRLNVGVFPDGTADGGLIVLTGNPELRPERVESFELGYRWQPAPNVAVDATAYHNDMRGLVQTATDRPFRDSSGRTIIPINFANSLNGDVNGAEFLVTDSVAADWDVVLGYAYSRSNPMMADTSNPRHQLQLRSSLRLAQQLALDSSAYYVGRSSGVPSYLRFDQQVTWHSTKRWELSISGQNLLRAHHTEFVTLTGLATPVQRSVSGRITWRH